MISRLLTRLYSRNSVTIINCFGVGNRETMQGISPEKVKTLNRDMH